MRYVSRLIKLKADVSCSVQFHIRKDQVVRRWLIDLKQPPQVNINTNTSASTSATKTCTTDTAVSELVTLEDRATRSDVVIACSDEVFLQLLTKKLSPEYAHFSGVLTVKGNPLLVEKVKILLKCIAESSTQ